MKRETLMFSDFLNATKTTPAPKPCSAVVEPDTCAHKNVRDIRFTLVTRASGESKLYEAFCTDCKRIVYGQTGAKRIPFTVNREKAYSEE